MPPHEPLCTRTRIQTQHPKQHHADHEHQDRSFYSKTLPAPRFVTNTHHRPNHPSKRPHKADYNSVGFLYVATTTPRHTPLTNALALASRLASVRLEKVAMITTTSRPERSGAERACVVRSWWWEVRQARMGRGRHRGSVRAIAQVPIDGERAVERGRGASWRWMCRRAR